MKQTQSKNDLQKAIGDFEKQIADMTERRSRLEADMNQASAAIEKGNKSLAMRC